MPNTPILPTRTISPVKTPFGLSFLLEDLVFARRWAEQAGLALEIALDRTVDGAEFEELLRVTTRDRAHCLLTIWRTERGVVGQEARGLPLIYGSVRAALAAARLLRPRGWQRFLR